MNDYVIIDSFFSIYDDEKSEFNMFANFEQNGNDLRIYTGDIKAFNINDDDYTVQDVDASLEIKYTNNKIDTYAVKTAGKMGTGFIKMSANVKVADGADITIQTVFEGYEEYDGLNVKSADLPSNGLFNEL